ncbi:MAG: N-formylglutamate amidohydrolase, partial [Acidimicrobiaceae bacterium]|nr:N-formylglutamate amidohydrolase [Acidimicrobiaceae bacterium]
FRSPLPFSDLHDNVSMYVEQLFARSTEFGATMLYACFPNTYIDPNRDELDIDPELVEADQWPEPLNPTVSKRGLGLLKSVSRYGDPLQERKLTYEDVERRLNRYHRPYNEELTRVIRDKRHRFGYALQLSCHCMSAVGAPTHPDKGQDRADFCIADGEGTTSSAEALELLVETLRDRGHSVSINTPYTGGPLMTRNADPENGVDSLMIETNKRLFMSIKSFERTEGFESTQASLTHATQVMADYAASRAERS